MLREKDELIEYCLYDDVLLFFCLGNRFLLFENYEIYIVANLDDIRNWKVRFSIFTIFFSSVLQLFTNAMTLALILFLF